MSETPRVSIGLPVYNGERFLREALDSLVGQTFGDFELIISDNGSTDGTQEICRAYAAKDRRIRYYRQDQNHGGAWNHNRVFELSKGEYFKWASHDDVCDPALLSRCVEVLDADPSVVLCYSKVRIIDEHGRVENYAVELATDSPNPQERFRDLMLIPHRCFQIYGLIRSRDLKMTPLFAACSAADRPLLARLGLAGRFHEVPEYLFVSRWHSRNSMRATRSAQVRIAWWDPAMAGKITFPFWRIFREYFLAIRDAQLTRQERMRCYLYLLRWPLVRGQNRHWLTAHWVELGKDLVKALIWPAYIAYASRTSDGSSSRTEPAVQGRRYQ
ncbi:MAG TPA: glycosyltransferase family 2 protein [Verrucomicrobiae bacterium]|nr:glycosyltransferase family 2 protein [Verrucomicrobiae bacterium]